ncbi:MAG: hypothetical protein O7E52_03610 [Candidatus Poribacteria bacterium]|nr:hypothetical protein [Candidatus Poribacteria bacterium]
MVKLSVTGAEIQGDTAIAPLSDLRLQFVNADDTTIRGDLFGKVLYHPMTAPDCFYLRFTAVPQPILAFLQETVGELIDALGED